MFLLKIIGGIVGGLILIYLIFYTISSAWFKAYFMQLTNINKDKEL